VCSSTRRSRFSGRIEGVGGARWEPGSIGRLAGGRPRFWIDLAFTSPLDHQACKPDDVRRLGALHVMDGAGTPRRGCRGA
jgi:hypothetical protein